MWKSLASGARFLLKSLLTLIFALEDEKLAQMGLRGTVYRRWRALFSVIVDSSEGGFFSLKCK